MSDNITEFLSILSWPFSVGVRHNCSQPLIIHGVTISEGEDGDMILNIPPDQGWIMAHLVGGEGDIVLRLEGQG